MDELTTNILENEALNQIPEWFDIPEEMQAEIGAKVLARERVFWLRSANILKLNLRNVVVDTLLRRAAYAEIRLSITEEKLAKMTVAFINQAKDNALLKGEPMQELERGEDQVDGVLGEEDGRVE